MVIASSSFSPKKRSRWFLMIALYVFRVLG